MRASWFGFQSWRGFDHLAEPNLIYTDEENCGSALETVEAYMYIVHYYYCRWYHLMWFCEIEIVHREKVEIGLFDDVTTRCYDHQITTQVLDTSVIT